MKARLVFFARDYQTDFFPFLESPKYESIYVTLQWEEKKRVEKLGKKVAACFEEMYDSLPGESPEDFELDTSLIADRYYGHLPLTTRLEVISKARAFWAGILDAYKPLAVVNEPVAIEISEVMKIEARKRGIKYFSLMSIPLNDLFVCNSITDAGNALLDEQIFHRDPSAAALEKASQYLLRFKEGREKPVYTVGLPSRYYWRNLAKNVYGLLRSIKRYLKFYPSAKRIAIFHKNETIYRQRIGLYFRSIFSSYDNLDEYDGFELIYYPLHVEPEATLYYFSEYFGEQEILLLNIAKSLSLRQVLVVKEHPNQPGMLQSPKFKALKKRAPNIVYLPAEYSSMDLLGKAAAVIMLTSSVGLEAILLGVPVFILGNIYFAQYPLVNRITTLGDLKRKLRSRDFVRPEESATIRFLAQLIDYAHEGYPFPFASLYSQENIEKVIAAFETEVEKAERAAEHQ